MFKWFKKEKKQSPAIIKTEESEEEKDLDEEELAKQGFDPLAIKQVEVEETTMVDNQQLDYPGYLTLNKDEIIQMAVDFKYYSNNDELRYWEAYKSGGKKCCDKQIVAKARSVGQEIIKEIGRKILSGSFNLTKISFPIKSSIPKTALETSVHGTLLFPLFMNRAAMSPDHLERFKLTVTAILGSFLWTNTFLKPLNPILGETLDGEYNDGTKVWAEQILHHPPVTYFLVHGPQMNYKYFGYYLIEAKAGMNSVTITNNGKRSVVFRDGQKIEFDFPSELYSGTFVGTLRQETLNKIKFIDRENDFSLDVIMGSQKKKPTDYFEGYIMNGKEKGSRLHGSYLSHINFDDIRYWDYREITPFRINFAEKQLDSDHRNRLDLQILNSGDIKQAQKEKEVLEVLQRKDKKLREEYLKKSLKK